MAVAEGGLSLNQQSISGCEGLGAFALPSTTPQVVSASRSAILRPRLSAPHDIQDPIEDEIGENRIRICRE